MKKSIPTVKIQHKDGDNTAINMIYYFSIYLKEHKALWDSPNEDIYLNRYYKGLLTKTIKKCDEFLERYKNKINGKDFKEVNKVVDSEFERLNYKEKGINRELLRTMFCATLMFDSVKEHKKLVIGVTLKMFLKDIEKSFEAYYKMWINEIDDNLINLNELVS